MMKKIAHLVSAGLIAQAMLATSAMAAPVTIGTVPTDADLQAVCQSFLKPNGNSGFVTVPVNVRTVLVSHTETRTEIGREGVGTPVLGGLTFENEHVNGKSPNIFADSYYTTNTYPQTQVTYQVDVVDVFKKTYDCKVYKVLKNGSQVVPPDQQRYGLETGTWNVEDHYTETALLEDDFVEDVRVLAQEGGVVCTSPGRNGGTWTQQNGYTGDCSLEAYVAAGGDPDNVSLPDSGGGSGGAGGGSGGGSGGGGGGGRPPRT